MFVVHGTQNAEPRISVTVGYSGRKCKLMKQLIFSLAYLTCVGGWHEHEGFFSSLIFMLLYAANYVFALQQSKLEELVFDKIFNAMTGIGLFFGYFMKIVMPCLCVFFYYFPDTSRGFPNGFGIFLTIWIVWGMVTIRRLIKKS